ncbi:hypothetical protein [Glaciecola sp. SC05]|uniref:hypothetical protein n=1 Tax=Glaciecola sp. SC05 TaxID=1987355 RepID=UPI003528F385
MTALFESCDAVTWGENCCWAQILDTSEQNEHSEIEAWWQDKSSEHAALKVSSDVCGFFFAELSL